MALLPLDLPTPADLNHRWASQAAVVAAHGWDDVRVDGPVRYHHDGGGNWAAMALLPGGRALLFGDDHEMSRTRYRGPEVELDPDETDLLADAPAWWGEALCTYLTHDLGDWVGFVYGWEDGRWQRADYDLDDGFDSLELPMVGHEEAVEEIIGWWLESESTPGDEGRSEPTRAEAEAVVVAGPAVTPELLARVVRSGDDPRAGAAAAARFALPG